MRVRTAMCSPTARIIPKFSRRSRVMAELAGGDAEGAGELVDVGDPEGDTGCVVPADAVQQQGAGGPEDRGEPDEGVVGVGVEPVGGGGVVPAGEGEAAAGVLFGDGGHCGCLLGGPSWTAGTGAGWPTFPDRWTGHRCLRCGRRVPAAEAHRGRPGEGGVNDQVSGSTATGCAPHLRLGVGRWPRVARPSAVELRAAVDAGRRSAIVCRSRAGVRRQRPAANSSRERSGCGPPAGWVPFVDVACAWRCSRPPTAPVAEAGSPVGGTSGARRATGSCRRRRRSVRSRSRC